MTGQPEWWSVRRAHSTRPATYRCPFCGYRLHAMSEHMLIAPEGDLDGRRHAHAECVAAARAAGRFRTYDDWRAATRGPGLLERLRRRLGR